MVSYVVKHGLQATTLSLNHLDFEVIRMFRKGQFSLWIEAVGGGTELRFINRLFGLYA